jgi:hypothetical protein
MAFDEGLREASETGARAARRLLVPALWGAALVGGTLLAIAVLRMARRPNYSPALLRVSIEPRLQSRSMLPAIGGAVARFAVKRLLEAPATSAGARGATLPETRSAGSHRTGSHGIAPKDIAPKDIAPKDIAPKDIGPKDIGSHNNGARPGSTQGRVSA